MSLYRKKSDLKRNRNASWYVSLMRNGKRVQVCTGTSDRDKARMIEAQILDGLTSANAERVAENVQRILGGSGTVKGLKIAEVEATISRMLERSSLDDKSITRRLSILNRFAEWSSKRRGLSRVTDVTVQIAFSYIDGLTFKAKTRKNIAGELSTSWNMLRRAGLATENPWTLSRPKANVEEERSGTAFSVEELRSLLDESRRFKVMTPTGAVDEDYRAVEPVDSWMTTLILVAMYTGLRQCDCLRLTWDMYDGEMIHIVPSKTKRFKVKADIPVHPVLKAHLGGLERVSDNIIVGAPTKPCYAWNLCVKRAGITRPDREMTTFHSLRHTFATMLRNAGADKGEQMLLGGWTNVSTANRYDHDLTKLAKIVEGLPRVE